MRATIDYRCDWCSENGNDQRGMVRITTPTGKITASWSCTGGMGDGCELLESTATEFSTEEIEELLDCPDLCQGDGVYDADIVKGPYGYYVLENVVWADPQPS